jgi:hypothetical protein
MIEQISVDLNKLYANKLKLEDYFILFCLVNEEEELLVKYTFHSGGIDTNSFQRLRNSGFIVLTNEINITFSSIKITNQTKELFNVQDNTDFDTLFKELLSTYPNSVKRVTGGTRRLHNDLVRCKKLYKASLVSSKNIDLHKKILLCIQLYYREHLKDNKQEFMQLLATFLSQRTWEQYINEVSNIKVLTKDTKNYDAI